MLRGQAVGYFVSNTVPLKNMNYGTEFLIRKWSGYTHRKNVHRQSNWGEGRTPESCSEKRREDAAPEGGSSLTRGSCSSCLENALPPPGNHDDRREGRDGCCACAEYVLWARACGHVSFHSDSEGHCPHSFYRGRSWCKVRERVSGRG
ncbi:hypothetical protein HJG60_009670 [Phyllostomus discolor]|uniref:Uncharacterized protein n=1 Tax=Phyllostomus discolor TaxID=89673 RepID=A0A834EL69_9CHIR|nr:hypothetical protein HJG60_009670 [Phyllostomus discolor]